MAVDHDAGAAAISEGLYGLTPTFDPVADWGSYGVNSVVVRTVGLEPTNLSVLEPKPSAYANSAMSARMMGED